MSSLPVLGVSANSDSIRMCVHVLYLIKYIEAQPLQHPMTFTCIKDYVF